MIAMRQTASSVLGLEQLIKLCKGREVMVEVGCFAGESTARFAKHFGTVYAVDPFLPGYDKEDGASEWHELAQARKAFKVLVESHFNIAHLEAESKVAVQVFEPSSLDLVYLDGCHTAAAVALDIHLWLPKVKRGGVLAGHDYTAAHLPGVKETVDAFFGVGGVRILADGSWVKEVA
jgi:predicted O-methyltransferase YrrM